MAQRANLNMLRAGYAPAGIVAERLDKSLPTIHRMVDEQRLRGQLDNRALYIEIASLREHCLVFQAFSRAVDLIVEDCKLLMEKK